MDTETKVMTVGQRILWAREQAGFTQDRLAAVIGTTRQVVIGWEKDRHVPGAHSRRRLSDALGRDPGFFKNGDTADEEGD
jgi:transcriptional regulator with XRE-family HTH domain